MPLTIDQIIASAAADNDYLMVTSSDDIFYAHVNTERLTDTVATIASAVLGKADTTHTHSDYVTTTELDAVVDDLEFFIDTKANAYHDHDVTDVEGLEEALNERALISDLNAKASLVNGLVPASQLPSFVDDVLEYTALANFPTEGETGKIYVDQTTNKTYRWSGTAYVEISASLALGETESTAYRGDRGATAYSHSQNGDVHVTTAQKAAWNAKSDFSGSYDDLTDKPTIPSAYTHPDTHPATMITGLATVATSGSYEDLSNKPTIPTIPTSLPANGGNADTVDNKHASDFATANHSHSYNDLSNKPTIPSAYTHPATHPASMITGLATVATSGSYNDLSNKPTIPEAYTHPTSHPASMITGLADVATSGSYADLSNKPTIPAAYTHPTSHPASMITGLADVATSGSYNDLSNKPTIPAAYTHPGYAAKSSGLYKVTVDSTGHVSAATAVTKADITALGIPASDTNTTYSVATTSAAGLMSATDKAKLDGIDSNANAYTLPAAGSALGGVKTGGDVTISGGIITVNDDSHNHVVSNIDGLQTALDGKAASNHKHYATTITTTGEDLNDYTDAGIYTFAQAYTPTNIPAGTNGWLVVIPWTNDSSTIKQIWFRHGTVGSNDFETYVRTKIGTNAWGSWSKYYTTSNPPTYAEVGASPAFTSSNGGVEYSYGSGSGKNVLTEISNMPVGFHTAYAISGTTGNPRTSESFRFLIHKTSGTIGWILAWDAQGSIFTNYQSAANTFKGWKCLYDTNPNSMILWSGASYLSSPNSTPQVVTPSKKLSECRTGWMLLWSDYDPGSGSNDTDFCTTFIPKFTPSGGTWGGKAFYCDIPMYVGSDATDLSTEKRCIKPVYVHDDCLKGSYQNTSGGRNDVVLRAVYEV